MKFLIILIFLMVGCSSLETVPEAHKDVISGKVQEDLKRATLTDTEQLTLVHANNFYIHFVDKWKPGTALENKTEFLKDYNSLKEYFLMIKAMTLKKKTEYPEDVWARLQTYNKAAEDLDKAVQKSVTLDKFYDGLKGALGVALMAKEVIRELRP